MAVRRRRWFLTSGLAIGLAALVWLGLAIYQVHFREERIIALYGKDPRILVSEQLGYTSSGAWGRLRYDEETKCLYLETSSSKERPEVFDRPIAVIWPKGTRPVTQDGKHGVRVGGFLGRFGGSILLEGDLLIGTGGGPGYVRQVTQKPGEKCYKGTLGAVFGTVERVDTLPDLDIFDPTGPPPLYLDMPIGDINEITPVVDRS